MTDLKKIAQTLAAHGQDALAAEVVGISLQIKGTHEQKTAAGFDPTIVEQIGRMTDHNQHLGAYILGARMLGDKLLEKKFSLLQELAKLEGHLTQGLSNYNDLLYKNLMRVAEQKLSPEEYGQFNSAY